MQTQVRSIGRNTATAEVIGNIAVGNGQVHSFPAAAPKPRPAERAKEAQDGALTEAQQQLVLEHLPIVGYVARQIRERLPQHIELDELVSSGTLGLLDAARKYDAGKGAQFRSYAQFRVRGAILDSLRSLDWSPRELRRKGRAVEQAASLLQTRLGRPPQDAEVAAEMGLTLLHFQQLQGQLKGLEITALNAERGADTGEDEAAFVPARESDNPLFQCLEGEARRRIVAAIDELPERERLVMTLRYFEDMNMREIGTVLGVVESRISQIHTHALHRLRGLLADLHSQGRKPLRRAS